MGSMGRKEKSSSPPRRCRCNIIMGIEIDGNSLYSVVYILVLRRGRRREEHITLSIGIQRMENGGII